MKPSFLIIEDDPLMRKSLENICKKNSFDFYSAGGAEEGVGLFTKHSIDIVLLDMRLPDGTGLEILARLKKMDEEIAVIMMTAFPDFKSAVETIKNGAFDYVIKPFEMAELRQIINKALEIRSLKTEVMRLKRQQPQEDLFPEMIGTSPAIKKVKAHITKVGQAANTPVLIVGASGTGKELIANAVHSASPRRDKPLVKMNCSALPEHLLESELFGYEKGAFTGAMQRKAGLFELADGGTLFLDEISEMQLTMQPKFLRILEGHPFKRLGGTKDIHADVRIIAAANRNVENLVRRGEFREDLFYRLSAFAIEVPTLKQRPEDILLFTNHFLAKFTFHMRKKIVGFSGSAQNILQSYDWPGNVRELRNVIERAVILCDEKWISSEHLPSQMNSAKMLGVHNQQNTDWTLTEIERRHILWVLEQTGGNKSAATRRLGIARSTFDEKLKKYQSEL